MMKKRLRLRVDAHLRRAQAGLLDACGGVCVERGQMGQNTRGHSWHDGCNWARSSCSLAAYNRAMRATPLLLLLALATGSALAQDTSQNTVQTSPSVRDGLLNQESKPSRPDQRIEHIRVEDEGSRIDELRVGGQTQSITVQPKVGNMPEYEVQPSDGVRNRPRNGLETDTGSRVWNLKKF